MAVGVLRVEAAASRAVERHWPTDHSDDRIPRQTNPHLVAEGGGAGGGGAGGGDARRKRRHVEALPTPLVEGAAIHVGTCDGSGDDSCDGGSDGTYDGSGYANGGGGGGGGGGLLRTLQLLVLMALALPSLLSSLLPLRSPRYHFNGSLMGSRLGWNPGAMGYGSSYGYGHGHGVSFNRHCFGVRSGSSSGSSSSRQLMVAAAALSSLLPGVQSKFTFSVGRRSPSTQRPGGTTPTIEGREAGSDGGGGGEDDDERPTIMTPDGMPYTSETSDAGGTSGVSDAGQELPAGYGTMVPFGNPSSSSNNYPSSGSNGTDGADGSVGMDLPDGAADPHRAWQVSQIDVELRIESRIEAEN